VLPQFGSLDHSYQVLRDLNAWLLMLAVAAQVTSYLWNGYSLAKLARIFEVALTVWNGTIMILAGASVGLVAGGVIGSSAAMYGWLQRERVRPQSAAVLGSFPAIANNALLVVASLAGIIHLLVAHELTGLQVAAFGLLLTGLLGAAAFLVWGLRHRVRLTGILLNLGRRWAHLLRRPFDREKLEGSISNLYLSTDQFTVEGLKGPVLGAALYVVFDMLTLYALFFATGYPIRFAVLLTGYGLPLLLGRLAFLVPGGVGVIESSMAGLYTGLGVPSSTAIVVVLVYRLISFWAPLLIGFPFAWVLQRKKRKSIV
jgi:uncharacterized protein (TIRG00374 family)